MVVVLVEVGRYMDEMKAKPGQLRMGWSKREDDIVYAWGSGVDKTDAALLHGVMSIIASITDKTFIQELEYRGYDITTISFSIKKRTLWRSCFPACKSCEYNPCDLANNSDYCPARGLEV
jgi:hypothetical protein